MDNKVLTSTDRPFQPLQQLVPHQNDVLLQSTTSGHSSLYGLVLPIASAGASIMVLIVIIISMCFFKRKKQAVGDISGPSIVVYPSYQGAQPQFLTKDILFSLPALKPSNSLGDLTFDDDYDPATESLLPIIPSQQRSNSFCCYGLGVIDPALYRSASMELDENLTFPEGHLGRIWFSVRYEPSTEKLLVSILKAKNLPSRTVGTVNNCDPFVRLHLIPDERRYLQSRIKKKTCNPFFDETFIFQASSKDLEDHVLKLTVVDSGRAKRTSAIGHVILPLAAFADGDQKLVKMDLEKEVQESVASDLGELLVSLVYNDSLSRLSVTVIEAKRLKFKDDKQDSYVRVTLNQNYRPVKIKKTSTVRCCDQPNFSECFNFKVTSDAIDVSNLSFYVYQTVSGYGRDRLIGKFVIGSYMFARGKANTHWTSTFSSPKEAVQQWHSLCA